MTKETLQLYEGAFIIKASLSEDARTKAFERVKALVEDMDGEILKIHEWGRRRLAYRIDDQREGYYYIVFFTANPGKMQGISAELRLNEDLLRYVVYASKKVQEKIEFKPLVLQ